MNKLVVAGVCAVLLAGCATGSSAPPIGASVQTLEAGRFHVTYRGTSHMSPPEVQDRALLQAAQITLSNGYDWFQVVNRSQGPAPPTSPQFSLGLGLGGASFGRGGGVGGGVGGAETFGGGASTVVTMEIVGGHGPVPSDPNAYNAHDIVGTLGPKLGAPPQ